MLDLWYGRVYSNREFLQVRSAFADTNPMKALPDFQPSKVASSSFKNVSCNALSQRRAILYDDFIFFPKGNFLAIPVSK